MVHIDTTFPPELSAFIVRHIESVEALEILLLLAGRSSKAWTVDQILARLQTSRDSIVQRLEEFSRHGLVEPSADMLTYRYRPQTPEVEKVVAQLASAYKEKPVKVITRIYDRPSPARPE